ncbi:MAG: hypothetical protein DRH57_08935 [Candidatus Cloacimonadota bacterium]|nr:MAG: hypothetical protein DRH57_08935 [Candidatus Cloacimonadota bacterium]
MTYGNFSSTAPQVADAFKVEQAFKILVTEVQRLTTVEATMMTVQAELTTMSAMYEEILEVMRKMGKDYPEVVLAKPHLFVDNEFAVTVK